MVLLLLPPSLSSPLPSAIICISLSSSSPLSFAASSLSSTSSPCHVQCDGGLWISVTSTLAPFLLQNTARKHALYPAPRM
jgi:hypothetical protein